MGLFSFYKVRKPRQFDHKPIYWDPHREEMLEHVQRIKRELGMEDHPENYRPHIKGRFVEATLHLKRDKKKGNDPRTRSHKNVYIVAFLAFLVIFLWIFVFR
ncbi:MAG: hypothetical protein LBU03_03780 [Tannerellaceae bacterium]|jgi:hypothetical protein|nr:hypothetical protein [Tannerellaceae bacterium]